MSKDSLSYPEALPFWTKETLRKFCRAAVPRTYKKGETILHPLMQNQSLYLLESGVIDHRYFSSEGDAMTIMQVRPGELIGIKAIFQSDNAHKFFFEIADTDVKLWQISIESFLSLMQSDFEFTTGVLQYFVHYINIIQRRIMRSAILDHYQHLVMTLLDYAENFRGNTAEVRMTQQNLADLLALSRQSVSAYLSAMSKRGLISVQRGRICILDWSALNMELLQDELSDRPGTS